MSTSWAQATEPLRTRWRRARRAFDLRPDSERRLLVIAAVALGIMVADALVVTPAYKAVSQGIRRLRDSQETLASLQMQSRVRVQQKAQMQALVKAELAELRQRLLQQRQAFDHAQEVLVPASQMREVLEGLLGAQKRLRLLSIRTLERETVSLPESQAGTASVLYKHGLEVRIAGGFHDLLNWLLSVEDLPRQLLWDSLELKADDLSRLELMVRVHTLSRDAQPLELAR